MRRSGAASETGSEHSHGSARQSTEIRVSQKQPQNGPVLYDIIYKYLVIFHVHIRCKLQHCTPHFMENFILNPYRYQPV